MGGFLALLFTILAGLSILTALASCIVGSPAAGLHVVRALGLTLVAATFLHSWGHPA
jgi:hypothetical protein